MITVNDKIWLYIFSYLLIPILLVSKTKLHKKWDGNSSFLSKNYTDTIKGLAVVIIILHHFSQRIENVGLMYPFLYGGYLSVSIFLFSSGYGLTLGFLKKSNYLIGFIKAKASALYVPFCIATLILGLMFNVFTTDSIPIYRIIIYAFTFRSGDTGNFLWYMVVQLLLYVLFYFSFRFCSNEKKAIATVFVFCLAYIIFLIIKEYGSFWYNTVLLFPMGCSFAWYRKEISDTISLHFWKFFMGSFLAFTLSFILRFFGLHVISDILSALFFVIGVVTMSSRIVFSDNLFSKLGKMSLESYIVQMSFLKIVLAFFEQEGSYQFFVFFIGVLIIASFVRRSSKAVLGKVNS